MTVASLSLAGFGLVGAIAPAGRIIVTVIPRITVMRSAQRRPNPAFPAPSWSFAVPFVLAHVGDQAWYRTSPFDCLGGALTGWWCRAHPAYLPLIFCGFD